MTEEETGIPSTLKQGSASKIFIGNLPFKITNVELTDLFGGFGTVIGVNIRKDRMTDKAKGFAFITFDTPAAATLAMQNMHGKTLEGRVLTVKPALARGQQDGTKKSAGTNGDDAVGGDSGWATAPPKRRHRENMEERTRRMQNGGTYGGGPEKGKGKRRGKGKGKGNQKQGPKSWTSWAGEEPTSTPVVTATRSSVQEVVSGTTAVRR